MLREVQIKLIICSLLCLLSLYLQNVTFMATYLVVLMQFKLTLLRQAARHIATTEEEEEFQH